MLDLREVRSLTDFQRNARSYVERMRETGKPVVLTVNGRAEVVVQDAAAYQQLLDRLDQLETAETIAALGLALAEEARGEAVPAREALEALGRKYGIPG
jgi:prevent-host-death family protein